MNNIRSDINNSNKKLGNIIIYIKYKYYLNNNFFFLFYS